MSGFGWMMRPAFMLALICAPAHAQDTEVFYDLADEPESSMKLLALGTIAGSGANMSVNVVDIFRGEQKFGLLTTWQLDCTKGTMKIIKAMQFAPGQSGKPRAMNSEIVKASATPTSRTMFRLVCTGGGSLQEVRVRRGTLTSVIRDFWK